jgi:hypothetical protein
MAEAMVEIQQMFSTTLSWLMDSDRAAIWIWLAGNIGFCPIIFGV